MILTYSNYKQQLGEAQREKFLGFARHNPANKPIVLKDGVVRYANIDEY